MNYLDEAKRFMTRSEKTIDEASKTGLAQQAQVLALISIAQSLEKLSALVEVNADGSRAWLFVDDGRP